MEPKTVTGWPKQQGIAGTAKTCCICNKPISPGERYYYLTRKKRRYFHESCYRKELPDDNTGAGN
jgi:hypothetical protein